MFVRNGLLCVYVCVLWGEMRDLYLREREKNVSKWCLGVAVKWISAGKQLSMFWNDYRFIQTFITHSLPPSIPLPFNPTRFSFPFLQQTHTNHRKIQLNLSRTQYFLLDPIRFLQNRVIQQRIEGCIRSSSHQRWRIRHKRRWKCAFCWLLNCWDICRRILQGRW